MGRLRAIFVVTLVLLPAAAAQTARADNPLSFSPVPTSGPPAADGSQATPQTEQASKLAFLPRAISQDLDVNLWGWIGYIQEKSDDWEPYWDGEIQLDLNKSFGDRLAVTADVNFIDSNDHAFGQLEQMFATAMVYEPAGTLISVGKFNASFGVEARDFWNRSTGTTSLLFSAEPQDLVGVMLTQPIGQTGIKLRPFIVNRFDGKFDFDQPPSAGLTVEYKPDSTLILAITNWAGPGFLELPTPGHAVGAGYGSERGMNETGYEAAESYSTKPNVISGNYLGPALEARTGGTLYFVDAKAIWYPRPDLMLAVEGLFANTSSSNSDGTWGGCMALANYDVTDRLHIFGRWSFLADPQWIVTGNIQHRHELSTGFGYQFVRNVEFRTEYRHDFSDAEDDVDSVSVHLSFGI